MESCSRRVNRLHQMLVAVRHEARRRAPITTDNDAPAGRRLWKQCLQQWHGAEERNIPAGVYEVAKACQTGLTGANSLYAPSSRGQ